MFQRFDVSIDREGVRILRKFAHYFKDLDKQDWTKEPHPSLSDVLYVLFVEDYHCKIQIYFHPDQLEDYEAGKFSELREST